MYEEGSTRIEHELDIVNVLTKLKNLDVLVKKCLTTSEQQFNAKHDKDMLINLDEPDDDEEDGDVVANSNMLQLAGLPETTVNDHV